MKKRLARIPVNVRKAAKQALDQNAKELIAKQREFVPEDQGDLKESIRQEAGRHELSVTVTAGGPLTTRPVRKGAKAFYDYALAQEFGTRKMPANPFFFPAYRILRRRMRSRTSRAARKAIRQG